MTSNNINKQNNYQGGAYQIGSASRVAPSSSSNPSVQSSINPAWGGGNPGGHSHINSSLNRSDEGENNGNGATDTAATHKTNAPVQNNHARGNVNANVTSWQNQHQQNPHAMYYGHQTYHNPNFSAPQAMNPYHQQQLYMQQQAQAQQRYYMMQQQQQHYQQQQQQQKLSTEHSVTANTPSTVYRTSYYATHGNAPSAAPVPAVNWPVNSGNNVPGSSSLKSNNSSSNKPVGMMHRAYPTSYNNPQHNSPYVGGQTAPGPNTRVAASKPKKKLVITVS